MITKRVAAALAVGALVIASCQSSSATQTTTPASQSAATSASAPATSASASAGASASASGSAAPCAATDYNCLVFNTQVKPAKGTPGGTLIMGDWQPVSQLNAFYTNAETDIQGALPILRGFATITADGKYVPDLAAEIPTVENGGIKVNGNNMDMTLKLKPNLKWSDGQPLTMNDFKFTWQWANDPKQSACILCGSGSIYPAISSVDVSSDGLSGTLHLTKVVAPARTALYGGWLGFLTNPIMPEHYMKNIPVADAAKKSYPADASVLKAPFSGPFIIKNISATEIDYDRNPNWTAGVSPDHQGAAYLDHFKLQFFGDKNGEIAAFKSGAIDFAWDLHQDSYPTIKTVDPSVGTGYIDQGWEYEHFDLNNDPNNARGNGMSDLNVRKAIAMSVDKKAIIDAVFPGTNLTPACSNTPPGIWYHKDETCPAYDPTGAQALLTQAGWVKNSAGNVAKNGKEMNLLLCTTSGNPTRLTELQKLAGYLKAIGIKSTIKTADASAVVFANYGSVTATTQCSINRGTYDIADFAYVLTGTPFGDYYYSYKSDKWPELGDHSGLNDTRLKSPEMDAALQNLFDKDVAFADQLKDAQAVQDAYIAAIPEVPIYYRSLVAGVSVHFGNFPGISKASQGPTWDVEDWYFKQ